MTDNRIIDIMEIEPRSLKPQISNPSSIKEISKDIPEVSLLINTSQPRNLRTPSRTFNDQVSQNRYQYNQTGYISKSNQASSSPWKPERPLMPITHINVQQSQQKMHPTPAIRDRNQQPRINEVELKNRNYSPDLRLKFYQKLQDFPKQVPDNVVKSKENVRTPPVRRQFSRPMICTSGEVSNLSEQTSNMSKRSSPINKSNNSSHRSKNNSYNSNNSNNDGSINKDKQNVNKDKQNVDKDTVKQLANLIKNQATQIQGLKMQINSLIALQKEKLKNQKLISKVRCIDQGNNSKPQMIMRQNQQITQTSTNTSCAVVENKISVGVMTSFEFTLKNKQSGSDIDDIRQRQQQILNTHGEKNNFILPPNISSLTKNDLEHHLNSPNELINQNNWFSSNEMQSKEPFARRMNMEQNGGVPSLNMQDKYYLTENNNEMLQSSVQPKIGWTFYNNILCQVNEILNNSHDIRQPTQHLYNTIMQQRSTARQLKFFGAKFSDLKDIVAANISQKITATVDSSYYPRVNYQTNAIPSGDSIDSNTSFHMRKLAMKYLGKNNVSESMVMNEQLISRVLIDNEHAHNNNLSMKAACNYTEKHIMTSDESPFRHIDGRKNHH
ncbi:probable serine/threonine-protein kinase DDB_G0282963 [Chelonus insularis]|uniref:probable serine/threonine-protein kinase DDB_G0282963 n=1 Tax=Chelonus insularis TaxID=460826 RepID=UPI00158B2135|nr:probable serine/threonine-protein kinase DDB_G0282963 [Chelonus insularis]